jgi:hypothetical protein
MNNENIIGGYKEYIVIEREILNELISESHSLKDSVGLYGKGIGDGIMKAVDKIKSNNIYNREFKYKS